MNRVRISPEWRAGMELLCDDRRGQQVYCTTHDPGLKWIKTFDELPPSVRSRLAHSRYNLCPTCVSIEARRASGRPSSAIYLAVITAIEQAIDDEGHDSLEDFK